MIEAYSSGWPIKFRQERSFLKAKLGDLVLDIQHIGSTSVPGLRSKPIIDIMVAVKSLDEAGPLHPLLEELGYSYKPELSSTERLFFRKGNPVEFHISIAQPGHTPYWENQILFRDFLISHPETAAEYEMIKLEAIKDLSEEDLKDLSRSRAYSDQKGPFIQKVLQLAREENAT